MREGFPWLSCVCGLALLTSSRVTGGEPWMVNRPLVRVIKEIYQPLPSANTVLWCWTYYVGPSLERVEYFYDESATIGDDVHFNPRQRYSVDNGRSWSDFQPLPGMFVKTARASIMPDRVPRIFYDSVNGVTLKISDCALLIDKQTWNHHVNYRLSFDLGRTYGPPKPIEYESGGKPYDTNHPLDESYLNFNRAAEGNNIVQLKNGTIIHALQKLVAGKDKKGRITYRTNCIPIVGKWDPKAKDYRWEFGETVSVPADVSPLGLAEPELAILQGGRILIVWRTDTGHKYFSVSSDGAQTFSAPKELRFDDGSPFYSPSSIAFMLRHSATKKLYWLGNIASEPPKGNSPRYPLVIAEVDETIPALKKDSMTLIDTRQEGESPRIQFSNFSLLENRETHEIEVFVSPLGANPNSQYESEVRRYRLQLL